MGRSLFVSFIIVLSNLSTSFAARPFVTDDAGTVEMVSLKQLLTIGTKILILVCASNMDLQRGWISGLGLGMLHPPKRWRN
jgi:hypothetical protein